MKELLQQVWNMPAEPIAKLLETVGLIYAGVFFLVFLMAATIIVMAFTEIRAGRKRMAMRDLQRRAGGRWS